MHSGSVGYHRRNVGGVLMSMSKLARSGMMDRLRKRMGEDQRQAIADKYGDEFRRGMEGAQGNPAADVSSALEPLRRAGQSAIDAGRLRPGDAVRATEPDIEAADDWAENASRPAPYGRHEDYAPRAAPHAEPDADDMGGPSDEDADDLAAPPPSRAMDRLRALRGRR